MTTHEPDAITQGGVSRRTVVKGAAWAAPVIALAVAAPLAAASQADYSLVATATSLQVERCDTLGAITVSLYRDGDLGTGVAETVTVTLPAGFEFTDGATTKTYSVDAAGTLTIPAGSIRAVPNAAGSYPIALSWNPERRPESQQTAQLLFEVTSTTAPTIFLERAGTGANAGVTATDLVAKYPDVYDNVQAAYAAEQFNVVALGDGSVVAFGSLTGRWSSQAGTIAEPRVLLASGGSTITHLASWSDRNDGAGNAATHGGALAIAADGTVTRWYKQPGSNVSQVTVTGTLGGTVQDIYPTDRGYYIHTSTALYWVSTSGNNPSLTNITGNVSTASITQMDVWGDGISQSSGAWVLTSSGQVYQSTTGSTFTQVSGLPGSTSDPIRRIGAHDRYRFVLTESGQLYRQYDTSSWSLVASNVRGFDSWARSNGNDHYSGVSVIGADGSVTVQMWLNGSSLGTPYTIPSSTFGGSAPAQVYAEDGIYSALSSDGKLYGWTGNPDNPNAPSGVTAQGGSTFTDAQIWGWHAGSSRYYGGGFASPVVACSI